MHLRFHFLHNCLLILRLRDLLIFLITLADWLRIFDNFRCSVPPFRTSPAIRSLADVRLLCLPARRPLRGGVYVPIGVLARVTRPAPWRRITLAVAVQ